MATTDYIILIRNPPNNASDIEVSPEAIARLMKAGGLSDDDGYLLSKHLPSSLLSYLVGKAHKMSAPTLKQREEALTATANDLKRFQNRFLEARWLRGALIAHETKELFDSKKILRSMARRGYPEHEHWDRCERRAITVIKDQLKTVGRLQQSIGQLHGDPIGLAVAAQQSKQANASQPRLGYLAQDLQILWNRVLGRKVIIGTKSRYFAFAGCLFELLGQRRSDDALKKQLSAARGLIESLPREK